MAALILVRWLLCCWYGSALWVAFAVLTAPPPFMGWSVCFWCWLSCLLWPAVLVLLCVCADSRLRSLMVTPLAFHCFPFAIMICLIYIGCPYWSCIQVMTVISLCALLKLDALFTSAGVHMETALSSPMTQMDRAMLTICLRSRPHCRYIPPHSMSLSVRQGCPFDHYIRC